MYKYVCVCTGSGDCRRSARRAVAEGGGEIHGMIKTIGRESENTLEREGGSETRFSRILFLADPRDDEKREEESEVLSVLTARDRRRGCAAAEYDRGRGDRRGAAATIEREPAGAAAATIE